jgi:L-amino acid N-acyltransferase YncA
MTNIRALTPADIAAVTAIYGHHVLHGTGTFETTPPDAEAMTQRWNDVMSKGLPWLVITQGERILGFAYANWFKPRPAYRFSAEDSIYLHPDAAGQGLGRTLLEALLTELEQLGVRQVIAVIGDSANAGSIGVHRSMGFEHTGVLKASGWKFEQWLDVVLMQKTLGNGAQTPPEKSTHEI